MHSIISALARGMALLGGIVLTALVVLTCLSVLGRGLNTLGHGALAALSPGLGEALIATGVGPVTGDFELVEAGIAFAIFAFLPICQLYGAHATVDVFTNQLPARANRFVIAFWEVVLTAVILLISWRLYEGFLSKLGNGQTTFLLQFPIWWAYGASFVASVIAGLVALYCAAMRLAEAVSGRQFLPTDGSVS